MNYIAIITDFHNYHEQMPVRAFRYADYARDWVDSIHRTLIRARDAKRTDDYLESAEVYRMSKSGKCILVDTFDGLDRGDGFAGGWENECEWKSEPFPEYGCPHTKVKGHNVCYYHKRYPQYYPPLTRVDWPTFSKRELERDAGLVKQTIYLWDSYSVAELRKIYERATETETPSAITLSAPLK